MKPLIITSVHFIVTLISLTSHRSLLQSPLLGSEMTALLATLSWFLLRKCGRTLLVIVGDTTLEPATEPTAR